MELAKHMATINGQKTYYWQAGSLAARPIVFLHGFPGNHLGLVDFASRFVKNYRVIMLDLPACGESETLAKYHGVEGYSEWLNLFLESVSLPRAIILGHSFGARVAIHFTAAYPEKTFALILLAPVVGIQGILAHLAWLRYRTAKLLPALWQKAFLADNIYQYLVFWITFKSSNKARRNEIMRQSMNEVRNLNTKVHFEMMDDLFQSNIIAFAKRLNSNCLVIGGIKDEVAPVVLVQKLAAAMKNTTVHFIQKTGHLLPIEKPDEVADVIYSWLKPFNL